MPRSVHYENEFPYRTDPHGDSFPVLTLRVSRPEVALPEMEFAGYLDSGAQFTLLDGRFLRTLELDLLAGSRRVFQVATGLPVFARVHEVRLSHPLLGTFRLSVSFSEVPLVRNILGRDFFNLVQIGFREHHLTFYVTPRP